MNSRTFPQPFKILFVCLGNICRSPTAEAIMKKLVAQRGLNQFYHIDSAGTSGYHLGTLPDPRTRKHGANRSYQIDSLSRKVIADDFSFSLLLAMDDANYDYLLKLAPTVDDQSKVRRMIDFCTNSKFDHVPDPYYEGANGFDLVLDILENACANLLTELEEQRESGRVG